MKVISVMPGHGNRPEGWDTGAISPAGWEEADLVRGVGVLIWRDLQLEHIPAELVAAGSYHQRGEDAEAGAGSSLVVQLHADAVPAEVGPDRSRVFYWPGNVRGQAAAELVAAQLRTSVPWPVTVHEAGGRWPGPRACLAAVGPTSILVELGFTDGIQGRSVLIQSVNTLGAAVANGLIKWWAMGP
jgi:N-acetylmuramoyl-L-alanine amidase